MLRRRQIIETERPSVAMARDKRERDFIDRLAMALYANDVEGFLGVYDGAIRDGFINTVRADYLKDVVRDRVDALQHEHSHNAPKAAVAAEAPPLSGEALRGWEREHEEDELRRIVEDIQSSLCGPNPSKEALMLECATLETASTASSSQADEEEDDEDVQSAVLSAPGWCGASTVSGARSVRSAAASTVRTAASGSVCEAPVAVRRDRAHAAADRRRRCQSRAAVESGTCSVQVEGTAPSSAGPAAAATAATAAPAAAPAAAAARSQCAVGRGGGARLTRDEAARYFDDEDLGTDAAGGGGRGAQQPGLGARPARKCMRVRPAAAGGAARRAGFAADAGQTESAPRPGVCSADAAASASASAAAAAAGAATAVGPTGGAAGATACAASCDDASTVSSTVSSSTTERMRARWRQRRRKQRGRYQEAKTFIQGMPRGWGLAFRAMDMRHRHRAKQPEEE